MSPNVCIQNTLAFRRARANVFNCIKAQCVMVHAEIHFMEFKAITVLASTTVDLYFLHNFHLDSSGHQKSFNWFNLSSKYSNSMENITGKRSDPVRKIINIAQKTRQHC